MTFDEFVRALYEAGWCSDHDALHEKIKKLWETLCEKGMVINRCEI